MKKELSETIKIAGKLADNWVPMKIQYDHTPGAVVCIAVEGKPKYTKAFGLANVENNIATKADSLFRVASMSKMFTAVAIMHLQEAGQLRIDDKVVQYLPWFKGKSKQTDLANVTIRQLLSHNSGIFRDGVEFQWWDDKFPQSLTKTISNNSIVFENATTFKYSNHGFAVLGAIIEKLSGTTYIEYVTKNVIGPLGLKNTYPDLPDELPKNLATGYERRMPGKDERKPEPNIKTFAYASATGFVSTAKDVAAFLASLHLDAKKSILSRESKKEMMRIHGTVEDDEMYGLGLALDKIDGHNTYGHSGGFAGYITNALSGAENNIQVIVLTNTISGTAWNISRGLFKAIYKLQDMKGAKYKADDPYSGAYRCRWGDPVVVAVGDDLIEFGAPANDPAEAWDKLEKKKQHVFEDTKKEGFDSAGERVQFRKIKDGEATEMIASGMIWNRII